MRNIISDAWAGLSHAVEDFYSDAEPTQELQPTSAISNEETSNTVTDDQTKASSSADTRATVKNIYNGRILNIPPHYDGMTDIGQRVFYKSIFAYSPIITLIPGLPDYKADAVENENKEGELYKFLEQYGEQVKTFDDNVDRGEPNFDDARQWLQRNFKDPKMNDVRYFGFKPAFSDFYPYVNLMLATVNAKMFNNLMFNYSKYLEQSLISDGFSFYANGGITYSPSISNSTRESLLAQTQKKFSSQAKELAFLTGSNASKTEALTEGTDGLSGADLTAKIKENKAKQGASDADGNIVGSTLSGSNIQFPKLWEDSTFSSGLSLSFKFVSPYGDPESIFQYVYVPFFTLLCMSLPRSETNSGYDSPFLIQAQALGYCTVELGMVTSFSFEIGGGDKMFNAHGLPMAIDVSMSIEDLYPTLTMAKKLQVLRTNKAIACFLNNLAGLNFESMNIIPNISSYIAGKLSYLRQFPDLAPKKVTQSLLGFTDKLAKIFHLK